MLRYDFEKASCEIAEKTESFKDCCSVTYRIQRTDSLDVTRGMQLQEAGYCFHDRVFNVEIVRTEKDAVVFPQGVECVISEVKTDDLYKLATEAFSHDRRFHLEKDWNQRMANHVIRAYLNKFEEAHYSVIRVLHEEVLLGFVVLRCAGDKSFENVLGCTRPGIKGKMIAYPMYLAAIALGKKLTCPEGKYIGRVSSTNMASLNLHMSLGARITSIEDEYILFNKGNQ